MRSKSAQCVLRLPPHAVHLRLAQGFRRTLARQRRPALVPQRGSDAWCRCRPRLGPPIRLTCLTGSHRINTDIPTRRRCALGNRQSQSAIHLTEGQGEQGARRATMTNRSRACATPEALRRPGRRRNSRSSAACAKFCRPGWSAAPVSLRAGAWRWAASRRQAAGTETGTGNRCLATIRTATRS